METHGYLTPEEARAQGVRWRPRHTAPTERSKERERICKSQVVLPELTMVGWSGWLCWVCRRVPLRNAQPWSWYGCGSCRAVDAGAAAALGGRRLLPLGQHSIMNGVSIRLSTPKGPGLDAKFDQLVSIGQGWQELREWSDAETVRLVDHLGDRVGDLPESVSLPRWQEWFPPSRQASADAFLRLLKTQRPWLLDLGPRLGDVVWLAEGES